MIEGVVFLESDDLVKLNDFTELTQITFSQPEIPTLIDPVTGLPAFDYPVAFCNTVDGTGTPNDSITVTHGGSGYLTQPKIVVNQLYGGTVTSEVLMPWDVLLSNITNRGAVGIASNAKIYDVKVVGGSYTDIRGANPSFINPTSFNGSKFTRSSNTTTISDNAFNAQIGDIIEVIASPTIQIKTLLKTDGNGDLIAAFDNLIIEVVAIDVNDNVTQFKIRNPGSGYLDFPLTTNSNTNDKIIKYDNNLSTSGSMFYNFGLGITNSEFVIYNQDLTVPTTSTSGIYLPFAASGTATANVPAADVITATAPEYSANINDIASFKTLRAATVIYGFYIDNAGDGYLNLPTFSSVDSGVNVLSNVLDSKIKPQLSYITDVTMTNGGLGYTGGGLAFSTNPFQVDTLDRAVFDYDFVANGASINNVTDFQTKLENGSLDNYGAFLAKYPGKKGNSLRVSMCDSSSYMTSLTGTITTKATAVLREDINAAKVAFITGGDSVELNSVVNNIITNIQDNILGVLESVNAVDYVKILAPTNLSKVQDTNFKKLNVGDTILMGGSDLGVISDFGVDIDGNLNNKVLYVKLSTNGKTLTLGSGKLIKFNNSLSISTCDVTNIIRVVFADKCKFNLVDSDLISRWKYADLFSSAIPGTSDYAKAQGGLNDELNVVIVDESGEFTGRKGQVLKRYQGLSKGFDAKVKATGKNNYYKDVINAGPWVWAINNPSIIESINVVNFGVLSDTLTFLPGQTTTHIGHTFTISEAGKLTIVTADVTDPADLTVYFTTDQGATIYKKVISAVLIEDLAVFDLFFNASLLNNTPVNIGTSAVDFGSSVKNNTFKNMKFPYDSVLLGGLDVLDDDVTTLNYKNAYDNLVDPNKTNIDLIMTGIQPTSAINYAISDVAEVRKDCIVCFSGPKTIGNTTANITKLVKYVSNFPDSSYAVMDSSWKYRYDKYNDKYRWIPMNGDTAGICARTDHTSDPWFSPGGFNRGVAKNVVKLALDPTEAQRDELYKASINPYVTFNGEGTVLFGDKTLKLNSAFDRINVRRLFITLESIIGSNAKRRLFEFNDQFSRAQFRNTVEPLLREVQGRRGIIEFKVICDESNNTPDIIDTNQFMADIYIKPNRSINYITLNFIASKSGISFKEINN